MQEAAPAAGEVDQEDAAPPRFPRHGRKTLVIFQGRGGRLGPGSGTGETASSPYVVEEAEGLPARVTTRPAGTGRGTAAPGSRRSIASSQGRQPALRHFSVEGRPRLLPQDFQGFAAGQPAAAPTALHQASRETSTTAPSRAYSWISNRVRPEGYPRPSHRS